MTLGSFPEQLATQIEQEALVNTHFLYLFGWQIHWYGQVQLGRAELHSTLSHHFHTWLQICCPVSSSIPGTTTVLPDVEKQIASVERLTSQVSTSRDVFTQPRLAQSRGFAPGGLQNQVLAL